MASAWGSSWGSAWGNSWGSITVFGRSGLGGDDVPRRKSPDKGWDEEAFLKKKASEDAMVETLKATYRSLTEEDSTASVLARVDAIVAPHAVPETIARDAPLVINWKAMAQSQKRAVALMKLWQEERALRAQIDEEDELILWMH